MLENFDFIAIFPSYDIFATMQNPDSRRIACKTYFFVNSNLTKNGKRTKKFATQFSHYFFD